MSDRQNRRPPRHRRVLPLLPLLLATGVLSWVSGARAYDQYSTSGATGNCATCHGNFRTSPYTSKVDGQSWGDDLHDVHRTTMLESDCATCHYSARFPTYIGRSPGGRGLAAYGCSGCHGRAEDGTGSGTEGFGAGLRQRHWRAGETGCINCHTDSKPVNKITANEKVKPPYYANPGTNHPRMPIDACNPSPAYNENFKGSTIGLDNDGNGQFDAADAACQLGGTPGEPGGASGQVRVTSFNPVTGDLTVSYGVGCSATDNSVEYGPLAAVSTYGYSGQVCAIGNTGEATFRLPAGNLFFLIVGRDASVEGSYGKRNDGASQVERPENAGTSCPVPQSLTERCDR